MTKQLNKESPQQTCESTATVKMRPKPKKSGKFSKSDIRYWLQAVKKPTYTRDDEVFESPNYMVAIQHRGKRVGMSLRTSNRDAAARRALEIYEFVRVHGWNEGWAKYRPAMHAKTDDPTVGEFIDAVKRTGDVPKQSLESYCRALRRIAADIAGVARTPSRFDLTNGGRERWLAAVGRVKLRALTSPKIQAWKKEFLAQADQDPVSQLSAKTSSNSILRSCKAMWQPRAIRHVDIAVPPSPFALIGYENAPPKKYSASFNVADLWQAAQTELAEQAPEQFKILLLALMAGLRRKEIDLLEWPAFKWQRNVIAIEATKYLSPKTGGSAAEIDMHANTMAIFKGFHARRTGSFVIESSVQPRVGLLYVVYRCQEHFRPLTDWLRAHGVAGYSPLHSMRKEFGSLINERHGIHSASRALRHSSVNVTDRHYVDARKKTPISMDEILGESSNVVPMKQEPAQKVS